MDLELHLLEHQQRHLEYLQRLKTRVDEPIQYFSPNFVVKFASIGSDSDGDYTFSISNDMVTEVYAEFSARSRKKECEGYLRTLTGRYTPTDLALC